jgi:DNA-binding MarR family transcriptional regulator
VAKAIDQQTSGRIMYLIHRTRVATADAINAQLADLGLNGTLALLVETLYELGETSASELARRCLVTRQAVTAPLNDLEARGLVRRPEPAANVRVRPTALTQAGLELAKAARRRVKRAEQESLRSFDPSELRELRELLTRYTLAWEQQSDAASPRRD